MKRLRDAKNYIRGLENTPSPDDDEYDRLYLFTMSDMDKNFAKKALMVVDCIEELMTKFNDEHYWMGNWFSDELRDKQRDINMRSGDPWYDDEVRSFKNRDTSSEQMLVDFRNRHNI